MNRRNTPAKKAILELLQHEKTALSQDRIEAVLKGEMDRVTIYRVLNRFCEDGVTHKILADDGKNYYALCRGCEGEKHDHNHFHFRCMSCHKIECLDEKVAVRLPEGYSMQNVAGWVTGHCAACA
jgi:Fur family ferric uptake transcriptional regulator